MSIEQGRRDFLKRTGAGALLLGAARGVPAALAVPFSSGSERPAIAVPEQACDCHMHIYDSRFPVAASATLRPPDALVADYRLLQARLGTSRCVVVQPSTYGTDNRCTLDAIAQMGGQARGVAVVDTTVPDQELRRLDALGIRGIRFNLVQAGATTLDMVEPLAQRVSDYGWHVQVHMLADQIIAAHALLQRLPAPLVIDHMGRIPARAGIDHNAFGVIRSLLDGGRTWVKLSGAYQESQLPGYRDVFALGRAYVLAAPERMVWGTDWPHPTQQDRKPDDAQLLDLLARWAPEPGTRRQILVNNPQTLYRFPAA